MNIDKLSDSELQTIFEDAFAKVAQLNGIGDFEVKCIRQVGNPTIKMEVTIVGLAGSPTIDDFKNGDIEEGASIVATTPDGDEIEFQLVPKETLFLNSNDYIATYESV